MYILGISCFQHDSAAALIKDGDIVAAAQEERFTRKRHDPGFPKNAVAFCLKEAGIGIKDIGHIAYYEKPFSRLGRTLSSHIKYAPFVFMKLERAVYPLIKNDLRIKHIIRRELGYRGQVLFLNHHESHASSAFFPSPFREAAIITMDGAGERAATSIGVGEGNVIAVKEETRYPDSLALLYSAFTEYTGFKIDSGEYKVMGLAPYGKPVLKDLILKELITLNDDGSFRLNMRYFDLSSGSISANKRFHKLFGGPPRAPESAISRSTIDIASSIQSVMEEAILHTVRHAYKVTGKKHLVLAGTSALNCVANGRIIRETPFKDIWIQPAAGDAGAALGAALFTWHQFLGNKRSSDGRNDSMKGSLLGSHYSNGYIEKYLKENGIVYSSVTDSEISEIVPDLLAGGNVIGWFQGRMEFGPRALGARSILGDARSRVMPETMNTDIKFREGFRPLASSVLEEKTSEYYDIDAASPYMLIVAQVKEAKRKEIPAVSHVDNSSRVQTVGESAVPLYRSMIKNFYKKYGCPVIINTSFNVRGEPIVESPEDAYRCFMRTAMDYIVIGNFIVDKKSQEPLKGPDSAIDGHALD